MKKFKEFSFIEEKGYCKKRHGNDVYVYYNNFWTFDIEVTSINEMGIPYLWAMNDGNCSYFGRYLVDFVEFLKKHKKPAIRVIYVHFLSYEFQFLKDYFDLEDVFFKKSRKPLIWRIEGYEFRCSYFLTNMSLRKFLENENVPTQKGDLDYLISRFPWSKLDNRTMEYMNGDVEGLHQGIESLMDHYGDDLSTIPLTSTGYVRRDCKKAVRSNPDNISLIKSCRPTVHIMDLLIRMFTGGYVHASNLMTGILFRNMRSRDIKSSYPYVMLTEKFPMGNWKKVSKFESDTENFAYIIVFKAKNVFSIDTPFTYLSFSKCEINGEFITDNGRVLYAETLTSVMSDVNFKCFQHCYLYDDLEFTEIYKCPKDYLPVELRRVIKELFYNKTTLEGVDSYFYAKSKNKLNATFGMAVSSPYHPKIVFENGKYKEVPLTEKEKEKSIVKYYLTKNSFLSYAWGVWITDYARRNHREGLDIVGYDGAYGDTDSVKYIGDYEAEFEKLNERIRHKCESVNPPAYVDFKGERKYLGLWEDEGMFKEFGTLGAKKYACENEKGEFEITIAGVPKEEGSQAVGSVSKFLEYPQTISDVGKNSSKYNDWTEPRIIEIDGHSLELRSNIYVYDTTYRLNIAKDYDSLLFEDILN